MANAPIQWSGVIARLKSRGMTQEQIAESCGITQTHVSRLARGEPHEPSYSTGARLLELADAAPLSVIDVLDLCERDFAFIGGCTMTDRPDLQLSPETSWVMDVSQRLADIRAAKRALAGQLGLGARVPEQMGVGRHG